MKPRNFIQETIDILSESSKEIDKFWSLFQEGRITKEQFEKEYKHILRDWLSEIESEIHAPNNGCKYQLTSPQCGYFKEQNI